MMLLMRNKPKHPPSIAAYKNQKTDQQFFLNFYILGKSLNFWLITMSFALSYSVYSTVGGIVGSLIKPFGFSDQDATPFGITFIMMGLVGSFIHAYILDRF